MFRSIKRRNFNLSNHYF